MTNTKVPAHTLSGVVCGRCSYGFGRDHVQLRHASVADVRECFSRPTTPVVEVPTDAQIAELFIASEAKPMGRYMAKCPRKGCKTVKVDNKPFTLRCFAHGRLRPGDAVVRVVAKQLFGTVSKAAKHRCDSRCINAVGPECVCACGGVNHGTGHLVG